MNLLGAVVLAEVRKLLSRPVARVGLVGMALLGAFGPVALWMLAGAGVTVNGGDLGASLDVSAPNGLRWALFLRNFFTGQVLLAVLAAMSFAGELQAHTLREDLVRPVPRAVVLFGKWVALGTWSFLAILLQAALASIVGLVLHPASGGVEWSALAFAFVGTWAAELSFAAVALATAVLFRSVAGTLAGLFLFLVFERCFTWGLIAARGLFTSMSETGEPPAWAAIVPFTPTSAWSGWTELASGTDPSWQPWVALVMWTALAGVLAERVFARTDVP
jgi:ABC-type transport system involved in multi-copper enzyme maturation permease subunit